MIKYVLETEFVDDSDIFSYRDIAMYRIPLFSVIVTEVTDKVNGAVDHYEMVKCDYDDSGSLLDFSRDVWYTRDTVYELFTLVVNRRMSRKED